MEGVLYMPKIFTINLDKGGTGKSTVSYNFAKMLALKENAKTLLIDGDRSKNLSFAFKNLGSSTITDIFLKREVEIYNVGKNLDFIQGSKTLEDDKLNLSSKQNNCMIFFMWIADNIDMLDQYDYIVIDTHNDTSLVTSNFIAVSDIVIGVADPSRNAFRAWLELKDYVSYLKDELIEVRERKSYVTAEPFLIANRIEHIGSSSKDFLEVAETDDKYLGMLQKKELLAKSLLIDKSIFEMENEMTTKERDTHKQFFDNVYSVFNKIISTVK